MVQLSSHERTFKNAKIAQDIIDKAKELRSLKNTPPMPKVTPLKEYVIDDNIVNIMSISSVVEENKHHSCSSLESTSPDTSSHSSYSSDYNSSSPHYDSGTSYSCSDSCSSFE